MFFALRAIEDLLAMSPNISHKAADEPVSIAVCRIWLRNIGLHASVLQDPLVHEVCSWSKLPGRTKRGCCDARETVSRTARKQFQGERRRCLLFRSVIAIWEYRMKEKLRYPCEAITQLEPVSMARNAEAWTHAGTLHTPAGYGRSNHVVWQYFRCERDRRVHRLWVLPPRTDKLHGSRVRASFRIAT